MSTAMAYLRDLAPRAVARVRPADAPAIPDRSVPKAPEPVRPEADRPCSAVVPKPSSLKAAYPREYQAWKVARQRCTNPKNPMWRYYGGKGVSFHEAWRKSFAVFLRDVGPRPEGDFALLRLDKRGHYTLSNVAWRPRGDVKVGTGKHERMSRTVSSANSRASQNVVVEERAGLIRVGGTLVLDPNQADEIALELIRMAGELRRRRRES